jgi:hypothetical protein
MRSNWRQAVRCGVVVAAVAAAWGCSGYRLGSTLPAGVHSVHVPPFVNRSGEPQLETETTRATIREFQNDGTLRIAAPDIADSVVNVTLVGYKLEPMRYQRNDPKSTSEYRIKITAEVVFQRRGEGEALMRRKVVGEATFVPIGDMTSAKRDALPKAARDLAHEIVTSVVEYW